MKAFSFLTFLLLEIVSTIQGQQQTAVFLESATSTGVQQMFLKSSVVKNVGNDVFTCGATIDSLGHYDILVTKHNSSNVLQWSTTYAGSYGGDDFASDIAIDGLGNVYVVGTKQVGTNNYDAITIKLNASGSQQWVQTYAGAGSGPDGLTTILLDGNNAIYVAGGMYQSLTQLTNVLSIKYDSTGTALWTNTWNNGTYNMQDAGSRIVINGGYAYVYSASQISLSPIQWKLARLKYDSTTGSLSTTSISAGDDVVFDAVHDVALDNINYIYVAGSYTSSTEGKNIRVARFDTDFESYWVHDYNGVDDLDDEALSIEVHGTSYVYVTGYSTSATTGKDLYAVKMTATGATVSWEETYDLNGGDDVGNYLALDVSNSPIIGATSYKNGNDDIAIVGIKSTTGAINYQNRYNSEYNKNDRADCLAIDFSSGSLFISGQKQINDSTYSYVLTHWKNKSFQIPNANSTNGSGAFVTNNGQLRTNDGGSDSTILYYNFTNRISTFIGHDYLSYQLFAAFDSSNNDTISRIDLAFKSGATNMDVLPYDEKTIYHNYYQGHLINPALKTNLYSGVILKNIYVDIDLISTFSETGLHYWFIINSGANPETIVGSLTGLDDLTLDSLNSLVISSLAGNIVFEQPKAYSMNTTTGILTEHNWQPTFEVNDDEFSFGTIGSWGGVLVIEIKEHSNPQSVPVSNLNLEWSTYFGGPINDAFNDISIDANGNCWAIGNTSSPFFTNTSGTTIGSPPTDQDALCVKFNPQCAAEFAMFYGGDGLDKFSRIKSLGGSYYLVGSTASTNLEDQNISSLNLSFHGGTDGLYVRTDGFGTVTADGCIGGSNFDRITDVDAYTVSSGNIITIVGVTHSDAQFEPEPIATSGYLQETTAGPDGFIVKLSGSQENVTYSSFFGSEGIDYIDDVELINGTVIIGGVTDMQEYSEDNCTVPTDGKFPTCSANGGWHHQWFESMYGLNYFLASFNWEGGGLEWSSFIGPSELIGSDNHIDLATTNTPGINSLNNIYIITRAPEPSSETDNIPFTSFGNYNQNYGGGSTDNAVYKFSKVGSNYDLNWCSYFGGEGNEQLGSILFDPNSENLFIAGTSTISLIQQPEDYCSVPANGEFPMCNSTNLGYIETDIQYSDDRAYVACFDNTLAPTWITEFGNGSSNAIYGSEFADNKLYIVGRTSVNWTLWDYDVESDEDYYLTRDPESNFGFDATIARFSIEDIISINTINSSAPVSSLSVFPNPTMNSAYIQYPDNAIGDILEVYDACGRLVNQIKLTNSEGARLDVQHLPIGVYLIRTCATHMTTKLVIE